MRMKFIFIFIHHPSEMLPYLHHLEQPRPHHFPTKTYSRITLYTGKTIKNQISFIINLYREIGSEICGVRSIKGLWI